MEGSTQRPEGSAGTAKFQAAIAGSVVVGVNLYLVKDRLSNHQELAGDFRHGFRGSV